MSLSSPQRPTTSQGTNLLTLSILESPEHKKVYAQRSVEIQFKSASSTSSPKITNLHLERKETNRCDFSNLVENKENMLASCRIPSFIGLDNNNSSKKLRDSSKIYIAPSFITSTHWLLFIKYQQARTNHGTYLPELAMRSKA